jgi:hypothetical protein
MPTSSLTSKTSYLNAKKIVDSVLNDDTNLYVYIGRPQAWENTGDDPPDAENTLASEYDVWHDITALKRVRPQDITLGFKRINWVIGTTYNQYSDDVDLTALENENYYIVTNNKKVYKCISNNSGIPSAYEPSHTTANITETLDGYKWKYMFSISDSLMRKFSVGDYLPIVNDAFIQSQATVGSIDHLKIISAGANYPINASRDSGTELPVYILGDGNENATATCNIETAGGVITGIISITDSGTSYPYAPETNIPIMIRQISETGAVETAFGKATTGVIGQITAVQIIKGGSGYVDGTASIVQSSCYGYAETNSAGVITNVEIATNRNGRNFRKAKAIVIANTATEARVRPIISPFRGHGASAERELNSKYILINLNFAYDEGEGDFTIENDFRRIGLIENPFNYGTSTLATTNTLNAKNTLVLSNISGTFQSDDAIYGKTSGAIGFNVDIIGTNNLRYIKDNTISNNIDFISGEEIESSSGAKATIESITLPEVEPYSGDILFINNITAVDRSSDQIETIALVLEY